MLKINIVQTHLFWCFTFLIAFIMLSFGGATIVSTYTGKKNIDTLHTLLLLQDERKYKKPTAMTAPDYIITLIGGFRREGEGNLIEILI